MLKHLRLENVGPGSLMEMNLAPRLNIITGNNGLGKSFLLDVALYKKVAELPWGFGETHDCLVAVIDAEG